MTSDSELKGTCLCGEVRLSVHAASDKVGACHCSMCRKWGGGPLFAVQASGEVSIAGDQYVSVFPSSDWAERGFCNKCGTHLFYRLRQDGHYAIPVGLLDEGTNWVLDEEIFIDEKPPFYSLANDTKKLTGAEVFAQYLPGGD